MNSTQSGLCEESQAEESGHVNGHGIENSQCEESQAVASGHGNGHGIEILQCEESQAGDAEVDWFEVIWSDGVAVGAGASQAHPAEDVVDVEVDDANHVDFEQYHREATQSIAALQKKLESANAHMIWLKDQDDDLAHNLGDWIVDAVLFISMLDARSNDPEHMEWKILRDRVLHETESLTTAWQGLIARLNGLSLSQE